ncbi:hypothetical protein BLA18112_05886 [Burkholderia lata]|uniref:Uncharacterized protein n=1 Tax=Burkholderia lata (strain ATCC 17760 / DSM 23089 / LMG 22485 / NCIMB 9086 / R18194 / 383) TaxID=482957 RepID=A0A6P2Z9N2_BURL3|nr:hypothetical protein BLA18112_05886 [Burkholderia lata]
MVDPYLPRPVAQFSVAQDFKSKKRSVRLRMPPYIAVMNLTHGM